MKRVYELPCDRQGLLLDISFHTVCQYFGEQQTLYACLHSMLGEKRVISSGNGKKMKEKNKCVQYIVKYLL